MDQLRELTIHQAGTLLSRREISSIELTQAVLDCIEATDNTVQAYLTITPELALAQAAAADRQRVNGDGGALLGIPMAIKDIICVEGVPTTCGSRTLEDFVPPYSATVVERLRAAGAVIVGKTNTDEFAMGSSTENSAYAPTHNPWNLNHVPGGSSGGSAAAVAADETLGAIGSDTGGSVRQPASFCGVAGMKPTYGRISRYGLVAFASSLDQIGPFGKDVRDAAIILNAIAGHDPRDSTSVNVPVPDYVEALKPNLKGMRVGVPKEYFIPGMQPEVESAVRAAVDVMQALGAEVREVSLPHTEYALPTYYMIAPAEASANLARYDGVKYGYTDPAAETMLEAYTLARGNGFGPEVKRRIMLGTYALSAGYYDAYYLRAQKVRTLIRQDFERAFELVDVIACPTAPTVAYRIGEKVGDPLSMYLGDVFTLALNLSGLCGISVPCGFADALPIGLQLIGNAFDEATTLHAAYAYEQATEWHQRKPPLTVG